MNKRLLIAASALGLGLAALMGCGALTDRFSPPKEGTVIEMTYDDPDTWQEYVTDYAYTCLPVTRVGYDGKLTTGLDCASRPVGGHYETRHDGPHWRVKIRSLPNDKGKTKTGTYEVSEADYRRYEIGSWYPLGSQPPGGADF